MILCSSFSKTVPPGFRLGWMEGGRFHREVAEYLPSGTRATVPAGGYPLWVELPEPCSAVQLFEDALATLGRLAKGQVV